MQSFTVNQYNESLTTFILCLQKQKINTVEDKQNIIKLIPQELIKKIILLNHLNQLKKDFLHNNIIQLNFPQRYSPSVFAYHNDMLYCQGNTSAIGGLTVITNKNMTITMIEKVFLGNWPQTQLTDFHIIPNQGSTFLSKNYGQNAKEALTLLLLLKCKRLILNYFNQLKTMKNIIPILLLMRQAK